MGVSTICVLEFTETNRERDMNDVDMLKEAIVDIRELIEFKFPEIKYGRAHATWCPLPEATPDDTPSTPEPTCKESLPVAQEVEKALDNIIEQGHTLEDGTSFFEEEVDIIRRALDANGGFDYEKYIENRIKPLETIAIQRHKQINELETRLGELVSRSEPTPLTQDVEDAIYYLTVKLNGKRQEDSPTGLAVAKAEATIRQALNAKTVPDEVIEQLEHDYASRMLTVENHKVIGEWLDQQGDKG